MKQQPSMNEIKEDFPFITLRKVFGINPMNCVQLNFFTKASGSFLLSTRVFHFNRSPDLSRITIWSERSRNNEDPIYEIPVLVRRWTPGLKRMGGRELPMPFLCCPLCKESLRNLYFKDEKFGCAACFSLRPIDFFLKHKKGQITVNHLISAELKLKELKKGSFEYNHLVRKIKMIKEILKDRLNLTTQRMSS